MKKQITAVLASAAFVALAAPAVAQDINADPHFGTARLSSGFTPDPYTVNVTAGGSLSARNISGNCAGYISNAPDVRLHFDAGSLPLIISAASSSDTTLVINAPDGSWYCDDDGGNNGLNPRIQMNNPMSGRYEIWIGTYSNGDMASARLDISELYSQ
ncbi:hypothetical protein [Aurantiacibacter sediminis]|uniref:Peptidase S1 n=1 Tax=Aurantiacibacter sediminis TaxID=2793064 RepID=A0ABS0N455_9SPHN|nr:hypothetical protein [Aurantiacibacter sediminis]MBH5322756.1 hypothetical protein [Aurantiacibacter sediminis]